MEIVPLPPPRVVGPGRIERGYREAITRMDSDLAARARELELAALVERGTQRALDRLERDLEASRAREREREQVEKRLCVALGALQRENELLRAALPGNVRALGTGDTVAQSGPTASAARPARARTVPSARSTWIARIARRLRGARGA